MALGVLKISCSGQIHRVLLDDEPSFAAIDAVLRGLWPGMRPGSAKYMDSDGDSCSLVEGTFEDFLTTSGSKAGTPDRTILKIMIADDAAPAKQRAPQTPEAHGTVTSARAARASRHRAAQHQVPETTWEEDERDLDELLCQLGDESEPAAPSKRKRQKAKKKEARAALKQQEEAAAGGVDIHASRAGLEDGSLGQEQKMEDAEQTSEPQADSDAEYWGEETPDPEAQYWDEDQNLYPDGEHWQYWGEDTPDPDAHDWGEEEAAAMGSQYWGDEDHPAYSAQTGSWQEALEELLGPPPDLPRAASCPCFPAWCPLLDDDEDAGQYGMLGGMGDPDIEDFFDDPSSTLTLWPPTPGSTPSATPRYQYHNTDPQQQVVWMPVPVTVCNQRWHPHGRW